MKRTSILAFAAGVTSTAALALLIATGPEHTDHKAMPEQPANDMGEMGEAPEFDMMAEMAKLATPGPYHQALGIMVGEWTAETSFSTGPGTPPVEGTGTMSVEWVLGKRYINSSFKSHFMGQDFEGIGYTGYDIAHEQYIASWMDTMSTKITIMTGGEEAGDSLVMHGTSTTPMGDNPMKIVTKFTDANTWVDTFYDKTPEGDWINSATITYKRVEDE
jgi:hypothetical protein